LDKTLDILNALANEKGLNFDDVVEAFKIALLKTAEKMLGNVNIIVNFDKENKKLHVYQIAEVVDDKDERAYENGENFIYLDEAHDIDPNLKVGDKVEFELDFEKLGRAGAANLQRELDFQILRLMEQGIYGKYKNRLGELITGVVVRVDKDENTYIEIGEVKGILPKRNRIKGESFKVGDLLKAVEEHPHRGICRHHDLADLRLHVGVHRDLLHVRVGRRRHHHPAARCLQPPFERL
jgi:N utilization substance protein A